MLPASRPLHTEEYQLSYTTSQAPLHSTPPPQGIPHPAPPQQALYKQELPHFMASIQKPYKQCWVATGKPSTVLS